MKKDKENRGGKRPGSGRKKKEPTKVMRIPVPLVPKVEDMIEKHKNS